MPFSHATNLIITGISMGLIHVLAGPDHLSALATLAVGSSWRAMALGIRWGLGHSAGLVVVAIIFIALKGELNLHLLGQYCDFIVGLFMIILGGFGIYSSFDVYNQKRDKKEGPGRITKKLKNESFEKIATTQNGNTYSIISSSYDNDYDSPIIKSYNDNKPIKSTYIDMQDPLTQRIVSFLIGLLHGVAGPGGILGVLPAVEMQSWTSSTIYLGSFIISSTLSMGAFAAIYGEVTKRIGSTAESVELGLRIFSASMSMIVGLLWIVLAYTGKLHIFH